MKNYRDDATFRHQAPHTRFMDPFPKCLTATLGALLLSTAALPAATVYYDSFETNPYSGPARWNAYHQNGSQFRTQGPFAAPYYTNWLAAGGPNNNGYVFIQHQSSAQASQYLVHTSIGSAFQYNATTSGYQSLTLRWDENRNLFETAPRHVAILIGNQWYASVNTNISATKSNSLDLVNTDWYALNVTLGSGGSMALDTSSTYRFPSLVSNGENVRSAGFYTDLDGFETANRTIRFDNLHLSTGIEWKGGSGDWSTSAANTWITGGENVNQTGSWQQHDVAIFGYQAPENAISLIQVQQNIVARAIEFYSHADGVILIGNGNINADGVPNRSIQINTDSTYRGFYIAPGVTVTVGGDPAQALRIYKGGGPLHIYGGGTLQLLANGMTRTETGGDLILNDGTTVIVKAGGEFNASKDLYIGGGIDTLDGSSGDATLILDGGKTLTRTGNVSGDLILGGPSGLAQLVIKNQGSLTTNSAATNGVILAGNASIRLESGGILSTRRIQKLEGSSGSATLIFDGGILHSNGAVPAGGTPFLAANTLDLRVSTGGAIIDTGGREVIFRSSLAHDHAGATTDGGLTVRGGGTLSFDVESNPANTFNGAVKLVNGTLKVHNFTQLGSSTNDAANLQIDGGTLWITSSGISTDRQVIIGENGATYRSNGSSRINGRIHAQAGTKLTIEGSAWLSGDSFTSFHGDIEVNYGEFLVRRASSLGSTTGGVLVKTNATFSLDHNGTEGGGNLNSDNHYADRLTLHSNATLATRGRTDQSATHAYYDGDITLTGPSTSNFKVYNGKSGSISLPHDIPDLMVSGTISGEGGINKTGAGKLILTNANTYTGKTAISEGSLVLQQNGSLQSSWIEISENSTFNTFEATFPPVLTQQTLSGAGYNVGSITLGANAHLRPGMSTQPNSSENAGDLIGTLNFIPGLTLGNQSHTRLQIAGLDLTDKLNVVGNLEVNSNAVIEVQWLNFEGQLGDSFDLLDWISVSWSQEFKNNLSQNLILPTLNQGDLTWDTSRFFTHGILQVAMIPEPSKPLLICLSCFALIRLRRRG